MKKMFIFTVLMYVFCLSAETVRIPLIRFDNQQSILDARFNAWGGKKKGNLTFDAEKKAAVLEYNESAGTFSSVSLGKEIARLCKQAVPDRFYLKYQADFMIGQLNVSYQQNGEFVLPSGLHRCTRPENIAWNTGGWNRMKRTIDPSALKNIYLITHGGSGKIYLYEIGAEYDAPAPKTIEIEKLLKALFPRAGKTSPVKEDGILEPGEWDDAAEISELGVQKDPENPTKVYVKAFGDGLYVAADCTRKKGELIRAFYKSPTPDIWKDETIEIHIDSGASGVSFRKIAVNANGTYGGITSTLEAEGIRAAAKRTDHGWSTEIYMPWKFLNESGVKPTMIGFNVIRNCYNDQNKLFSRSGWTTVVWNEVSRFGIISLSPKSKNAYPEPELQHLEQGVYFLKKFGESGTLNVTDPEQDTFSAQEIFTDGKGEKVLPFRIKNPVSGLYRFMASYGAANEISGFAELKTGEIFEDSIKQLPYNAIALFPVPKIQRTGKTKVDLTELTGIEAPDCAYAAKKYADFFESYYQVNVTGKTAKVRFLTGKSAEQAVKDAGLQEDYAKIQYDGFLIAVRKDFVLVAAKERAGAAFGANALMELIRMYSGETGKPEIPETVIVDWPKKKNRMFLQMINSFYHQNRYEPKVFFPLMDKFVIGCRYNLQALDLSDYYQWKCMSGFGLKNLAWSPEEFGQFVDAMNAAGVSVIPCTPALGHMEFWLFHRNSPYMDLAEDGGKNVICTKNPKSRELLKQIFDEMISQCSRNKGYEPKYYHATFDEVRWQTAAVPEEKRCKLCAGIPKNQIFLDQVKWASDCLREKGIRMLMWTDMISPRHNGYNAFKCAEIAGEIPKDIIFTHWDRLDFPMIDQAAKQERENWKVLTGFSDDHAGEDSTTGTGLSAFTYNWWLSANRCGGAASGLMSLCLIESNAWNGIPEGKNSWKKLCRKYGPFLMHQWSRKPMPGAGNTFRKVLLKEMAPLNTLLSGLEPRHDFSGMVLPEKEIAGIPMTPEMKNGCMLALRSGTIAVNGKIASMIVLHGANLPEKERKNFFKRGVYKDETFGPEIARYQVHYKDGTCENITIRYGWNITDWKLDADKAGSVFGHYLADSRWLITAKTPYAREKRSGDDAVFYQYEWVNPYPGKDVESIHLTSCGKAEYFLLAMTFRNVKKTNK